MALLLGACSYDALLGKLQTTATGGVGGVTGGGGAPGVGGVIEPSSEDLEELDHPIEPDPVASVDVQVEVRTDDPSRHPINPWIYGLRENTDLELNRPLLFSSAQIRYSTYNWENNASNSGYESCRNDGELSGSDVPGQAVRDFLELAQSQQVASVVVVPIGDHVSADKYGTDVRVNSEQDAQDPLAYLGTRFRKNLPRSPDAIPPIPDPTDGFVYQDAFLSWLAGQFPTAPILFVLDEEPDLWRTTLSAVRIEALGYAELVDRNLTYARVIREFWPQARILGLSSYGWSGWSGLYDPRTQEAPPDADGEFLTYYLDRLRENEAATGTRLIDAVDLHWISEARGRDTNGSLVRVASATDGAAGQARVQAPRSLWDPDYSETSWIVDDVLKEPIRLLPRIREIIAAHYPGTELVLGGWLFGGDTHITGALAVADCLGVLGRERIMAAAMDRPSSFALSGFRMFTNYDGQRGRFGDYSVLARTSDVESASAYASVEAGRPERMVVLLINKRETPTVFGVRLAHPTTWVAADLYVLDGSSEQVQGPLGISTVGRNAFRLELPGWSVVTLVPRAE